MSDTALISGSGPDGDFTEEDLQRPNRGALRVSLKLLPYDAVLRVFPSNDGAAGETGIANFVRLKHEPPEKDVNYSNLFCLHEYRCLPQSVGKESKKSKHKCKQVYAVPRAGGGVNISTLRAHAALHFPICVAAKKDFRNIKGQCKAVFENASSATAVTGCRT
jgi:hypothetical protein